MKRKLKMNRYSECYLPKQSAFLYKDVDFDEKIFNLILDCSDISKSYTKSFVIIDESEMTEKQKMTHKTIETNTSGPIQLGLIKFFIFASKAKEVLELGSFIGVSTSLLESNGVNVTTIEKNDEFARITKENAPNATVLEDDVIHAMNMLIERNRIFDLIFVDAGKENYIKYLPYLNNLINKNGVIVFDDIFFHGDVINHPIKTTKGKGVKMFLDKIKQDKLYYKLVLPIGNGILLMIKK